MRHACRRELATLAVVCGVVSCAPAAEPPATEGLGHFLDSLMVELDVPGMHFAAFDDEGIVFDHISGVKSTSTGEALGPETVFEAASISKPVFAYVVHDLAEQGVLDLDTPLGEMVPEIPDVGYDPRSELLTPRMLLTHQGGLPNWRTRLSFDAESYEELFAPQDTLRFVDDPGAGYRYSGEGYVLLQRVVEEAVSSSLGELARERVFEPLGMRRTAFRFDEDMQRDHAWGHDAEGAPDKWVIRLPLASTTLHTTGADLARFGAHMASEIRNGGVHSGLATPEVPPRVRDGAELSWGPGLGVVDVGPSRYVYHGGNNVIFLADFIYGVEENLGYVLLTNSANGAAMIEAVERRVFGRDLPR